jgi:signal transduction histidine kinase
VVELSQEQLLGQLRIAEEALTRCESRAAAGRLAGAVIHEVNNPLEALTNLIYLTRSLKNASPDVISYMELAETQLVLLGQITRKTLSFYRDQAEAKNFDLAEIVESALSLHSERFRKQEIELKKQIRGPAMATVFAGEILQIASNLILNALDALPTTGAALCVRVKTTTTKVVVTIADNGHGIPQSTLKTLFQPNKTTKSEGTGLGLWLSQNIANKHGGRICVRTAVKEGRSGTTFRLSIPLAKSVTSL